MWWLRELMDECIRQVIFCAIVIFIIGFLIGFFVGCETPYTGFLGPGDIDKYVEDTGEDTVCLADGFDSVCIRTIPGQPGKDGKDGISIEGPPGRDGKDGNDGKDGAVVIVQTAYLLLETPSEAFTLQISRGIPEETSDTYITPVATVEVPIGGGEPDITPMNEPVSVTPVVLPVIEDEDPPVVDKPVEDEIQPVVDADEIWHVMYRAENGQVSVFVYPRCFNNPYHNPPRPPCENDYGITEDLFFAVSSEFDIELQGNRESVRYLLELALEENAAVLVDVGGVQGVVN